MKIAKGIPAAPPAVEETVAAPVVVPIDDLEVWWRAWIDAKANEAAWKRVKEEAQEMIIARLNAQEAQAGSIAGVPTVGYSWLAFKRFDSKAYRAANPEACEPYMVDGGRMNFGAIVPE